MGVSGKPRNNAMNSALIAIASNAVECVEWKLKYEPIVNATTTPKFEARNNDELNAPRTLSEKLKKW